MNGLFFSFMALWDLSIFSPPILEARNIRGFHFLLTVMILCWCHHCWLMNHIYMGVFPQSSLREICQSLINACKSLPRGLIKSASRWMCINQTLCCLCVLQTFENEGRYYECDLLPFMEVGSVAHKYYLLNIRLPVNERKKVNVGIGEIKDIRLVVSWLLICDLALLSLGTWSLLFHFDAQSWVLVWQFWP